MLLTPDIEELDELREHCRLIAAEERDRPFSRPSAELLNPATCRDLLDYLTPVIGSPNRYVTASLLAKRIAFLTTGSALYALSALNRGLDLSLDNSFVEYRHQDGLWQSSMPLKNRSALAPEPGHRSLCRERVIHTLFAGHLSPLWQVFREVTRVPLPVLWENTAVRVYSLYERRLAQQACPERRSRIADDFDYLVNQAPARLFGIGYNPLERFYRPRLAIADSGIRVRKTCCYYYRATDPAKYCSTCPLQHLPEPH